jgi:hypothetical protein
MMWNDNMTSSPPIEVFMDITPKRIRSINETQDVVVGSEIELMLEFARVAGTNVYSLN